MRLHQAMSSDEPTSTPATVQVPVQASVQAPVQASVPEPKQNLSFDELHVLDQLHGLGFRKHELFEKEKNINEIYFCPTWTPQVRSSFRECADKIVSALQNVQTEIGIRNKDELSKCLVGSWESGTLHFLQHLGQAERMSVLVDMCGMMAMEIKLRTCLKSSFASLQSVPGNISNESTSYLRSILSKLS